MGGGGGTKSADDGVREINGVKLIARSVTGIELKDLRSLADEGKKQLGSGVVAIVGLTADGKAGLVVGVTEDLTKRFNAVDLVKAGAAVLGGKGGGGRPDMAQAGGPDGSKAEEALQAIGRLWAASCFVMAGLVPAIPMREAFGSPKRDHRDSPARTTRISPKWPNSISHPGCGNSCRTVR